MKEVSDLRMTSRDPPCVLTEFDMLNLMICKIFAKSEKVRVLQSETAAGSLDISIITCTLSNFVLIHFSSSIVY